MSNITTSPGIKSPRTPHAPYLAVHVTPEIIATALPKDSGHCMISDAVKAAFPDAKSIATDLQTIRFTDSKKGLRYVYLTPRRAQVALVNFDQGREPEPFLITLRGGAVHVSNKNKTRTTKVGGRRKRLRGVGDDGSVPTTVGGTLPPKAALASPAMVGGKRRSFGLRAMEL